MNTLVKPAKHRLRRPPYRAANQASTAGLVTTMKDRPRRSAVPVLDAIFLWIPNARRPGLLAFILVMARLTFFPLFMLVAEATSRFPIDHPTLALEIALPVSVLFEELGRYSFARRAANPMRAMILFTVLIVAAETVTFWRAPLPVMTNLMNRAPSVLVHVLAGAALLWGLAHRDRLLRVMVVVFVLHSAFDVASVQWFGPRLEAQTRAATGVNPIRPPHVGAGTKTPFYATRTTGER